MIAEVEHGLQVQSCLAVFKELLEYAVSIADTVLVVDDIVLDARCSPPGERLRIAAHEVEVTAFQVQDDEVVLAGVDFIEEVNQRLVVLSELAFFSLSQ